MTVELANDGPGQGPFVWPEDLKEEDSLNPYVTSPTPRTHALMPPLREEKAAYAQLARDQRAEQEAKGPEGATKFRADTEVLAKQARELRSGKESWRPGWMDYGKASGVGKGDNE